MEVFRVSVVFTLFVHVLHCDCASLRTGEDTPLTFNADGGYQFSYSLEDHSRQETGELKRIGDAAVYVVTGTYSYVDTDGEVHKVNYVADENGFRILPTIDLGDRAIDIKLIKTLVGSG